MVVAASGHGLATVVISNTGQVYIDGRPLESVKSDGKRKWALQKAIEFAASNPGTDVVKKADEFLAWLDQKAPTPPQSGPQWA